MSPTQRDRANPDPANPDCGDPRDALLEHLSALRAFAITLTRNASTADDLVQDSIVKGWTNFDKYTPGTNLKAWLFTILRNTFYSAHRKQKREVADPDGLHAGALAVRPDHDGRLVFAEFERAFDQLQPEHREVLILVGVSGFSVEEAAEMMGVAVGTIKSRTSRARKRLSGLMGLAEGEDVLVDETGETAAVLGKSGVGAA